MKMLIALLAAFLLLFGCIDGEKPPPVTTPPQNATQPQNTTQQVGIIVGPQQNVTVGMNATTGNITPGSGAAGMDYAYEPESNMVVYFIYVGQTWPDDIQGEAVYIRKGDLDILIDAGPQESSNAVIGLLKERFADDIDLLISTSMDSRRFGAMPDVIDNYRIEEFWWGGNDFGNLTYRDVLEKVTASGARMEVVGNGYGRDVNGIRIDVLNPQAQAFGDPDNDAIVLRLEDRNFSMLLTSNMLSGARDYITNEKMDAINGTKYVSAPYYGLGRGTSGIERFVTIVHPEMVIVSGTLDDSPAQGGSREPFWNLLNLKNIPYMKNWWNGSIRIFTDGNATQIGYLPVE